MLGPEYMIIHGHDHHDQDDSTSSSLTSLCKKSSRTLTIVIPFGRDVLRIKHMYAMLRRASFIGIKSYRGLNCELN